MINSDQKSYLSIDLDYWHEDCFEDGLSSFFDKVFRRRLPILLVESHENLLGAINKSEARVLYNVDFHSDFIGDKTELGFKYQLEKNVMDANWVNHVKWRKEGEYVWMHPRKECFHDDNYASCSSQEGNGACWGIREDNPFENAYHDWKKAKHCVGVGGIKWRTICGIGVSLSQDYLLGRYEIFENLVDRLKVGKRFYETLADRHCFESKWRKIVNPAT